MIFAQVRRPILLDSMRPAPGFTLLDRQTCKPQRCKPCRDARKNGVRGGNNGGERQMFDAVCAACGKACKVPFQPREDRPVYCSDCFARMKQN